MPPPNESDLGLDNLGGQAARAGEAFHSGLAVPAVEAAALIRDAMREAGEAMEAAFARAARTGRFSFADMARSIAADLARLTLNRFVTQPLVNVLSNALGSVFGGARADGGQVNPGQAFLVGERGPELFVPGAPGAIVPNRAIRGGGTRLIMNVNVADAQSFLRSEAQIAGAAARLLARANRNA